MSHIEEVSGSPANTEGCVECPIATNRRRFLRDAGLAVAAALIASGLRPTAALARAVGEISPVKISGALRSYPIGAADGVMIDAENDVILARSQGKMYAFSLRCPHKGARLEWHDNESRIFCPKHKARFLANGQHFSGRGTRSLDRYALRREGRGVVVDTDRLFREDTDQGAWRSAQVDI